MYPTLDEWMAREAIPFALDAPEVFKEAVDTMMASLGDAVELLGFGEALHGGEDLLVLRNRLFQRLVEAHGYSALAIESSFPRARLVNEYVAGRGPASYEAVQDHGFSHGFGRLDANREIVEWMRRHNADPSHPVVLRFYGCDSPTEMMFADSPRHLLMLVLDCLSSMDEVIGRAHRQRIEPLLGQDSDWENPAAALDPAKSVGLSPAAAALRMEVEELISDLYIRRPEWIAKNGRARYEETMHQASMVRWLLDYHALLARDSGDRLVKLLGLRDALMADNLAYIAAQERGRGKVLVFAHNSHLKRGKARWQLGPDVLAWWPAGSHLDAVFGPRYAVIGSAVGGSDENGIGKPEAGSLEAQLTTAPGPARFIPTHQGQGLPPAAIAALPTRSGSLKNPSYFPLTPQSLKEFDWLAVVNSTAYSRGGPPLNPST